MPFPGDPLTAEPFSHIQAQNARLLAEDGATLPVAAPTTPADGSGWPASMGPAPLDDMSLGLPAHLRMPGSHFIPSPEDRNPDDPSAGVSIADAATAPTAPDAATRALMLNPTDKLAHGGTFTPQKPIIVGEEESPYGPGGHRAKLYQMALAQDGLREGTEANGLVWKIACKTGTLALSPGPGNVAVDKPLHLTGELFRDMLLSLQEKAFPYCTVPETHNNGSLENTGYVRDAAVLTKSEALLDQRISDRAREHIAADPDDTEYLLAGIEFTNPTAKAKALEGSIPDTSIGVKFGWRNTRTGKFFKAAWEHLALTPMPWVDGLPAFGMSADGFKPPSKLDRELYDGVFVDLPLSIEAHVTSGGSRWEWEMTDINPSQIRADAHLALGVIGADGKVQLPFGVRVSRFNGQYVVQSDREQIVGIAGADGEALDLAMNAVRESYEKERESRRRGDTVGPSPAAELPPWPEMELAIHFDPSKHRRDYRGRFMRMLDGMDDGQEATLPGGVTVRKSRKPSAQGGSSYVIEKDGQEIVDSGRVDDVADRAIEESATKPSGKHFTSDAEGAAVADWLNVMEVGGEFTIEDADDATQHWVIRKNGEQSYSVDDGSGRPFEANSDRELMDTIGFDPDLAAEILDDEQKDYNLRTKRQAPYLSQDGAASGAGGLTLSGGGGELPDELPSQPQEIPSMPRTVEELLASQQVDLEQSQARIAALESQLQLAQGTIGSQGEQLHMDAVRKRIQQLEGVVSPSLALAAKTVMEADKSRITGEGGLNLSITTATTDAQGEVQTTEQKLTSPTDIVEFLLSAAATEAGDVATSIAGAQHRIGLLHASAHHDFTAEEEAHAAVEANERQRHPERFADNGKGARL